MQVIYVLTRADRCRIVFNGRAYDGFCGRNGAALHKREGDGKTPLGVFPVRYGFYRGRRPDSRLPMVKLHPLHKFIDDPLSPAYNRLVFGHTAAGGEIMVDHPDQYRLGLVVEYNRSPTLPGQGSAIFVHCGRRPTAGCIALSYAALKTIVQQLDPQKTPLIRLE